MKDYKNYDPNKYPEPAKRKFAVDFPPVDDLFTYGVDIPVPTTMDDLRCEYQDEEKNPLVLQELDGCKVPPLGLPLVYKNGVGRGSQIIYGPGTFRKDKYGIGKVHGASVDEIQISRANAKKEAISSAIERAIEECEEYDLGEATHGTADTLSKLAYIVTKKVLKDPNPREGINWWTKMEKILDNQDALISDRQDVQRKLNEFTFQQLDVLMQESQIAIDKKKQDSTILDGEFIEDE